jgi:peptidoglycan/LPS O-acetylase OafA/YrhL
MICCFLGSTVLTAIFTFRYHGLSFGFYSNEIFLAIPRVLMSYTAGMLVYRLLASRRSVVTLPGWLVCALLMLPLLCRRLGDWNAAYDLLNVLVVFPAILIAGASAREEVPLLRNFFEYAGKTSYAIYIMHIPLLAICIQIASSFQHEELTQTRAWTNLLFPLLALAIATVAYKEYDEPVRSAIRRRRSTAQSQRTAAPAESTL